MKKGDVLTVAQIAGVMGAKRTPDIIPMCHPILMDGINLELSLDEARKSVEIRGRSLIINLPGSKKASAENLLAVIDPVAHGLDMLYSEGSADCGNG